MCQTRDVSGVVREGLYRCRLGVCCVPTVPLSNVYFHFYTYQANSVHQGPREFQTAEDLSLGVPGTSNTLVVARLARFYIFPFLSRPLGILFLVFKASVA